MRFLHRFTGRQSARLTLCDSCARVCTSTCRSEALRDRTRTAVLTTSPYR